MVFLLMLDSITHAHAVGAKTFTMLQACLVGTVFEFVGALTLGSSVTDTIAGSIARPEAFFGYPGEEGVMPATDL